MYHYQRRKLFDPSPRGDLSCAQAMTRSPGSHLMRPIARLAAVFTLLVLARANAEPPPDPEFQGKKGSEWVEILLNDQSPRQRSLAAVALGKLWTDDKTKYKPALATLGRAIRMDASVAVRSKALSVVA